MNICPQVFLSRKIIPTMLEREKRSAIINLSSVMAKAPSGSVVMYSTTKAFNEHFSRSIGCEFRKKIDVMALKPFFVSTPLNFNMKANLFVLTPE